MYSDQIQDIPTPLNTYGKYRKTDEELFEINFKYENLKMAVGLQRQHSFTQFRRVSNISSIWTTLWLGSLSLREIVNKSILEKL